MFKEPKFNTFISFARPTCYLFLYHYSISAAKASIFFLWEKHAEPVSDINYKEHPFRGGYLKTFSKPLTSAQEKIYLHRCQEGDLDAKNILIERNLRLVAHIAKKYQNSGEDLEDLISIGTIGLIKAISTFDHTRCARLSTYAARCIDNELLMMFRSKKKHSREISLHEPIGTDKEGNEIHLLDILGTQETDLIKKIEQKENIKKIYEELEKMEMNKEKKTLIMRYGLYGREPMTQKEVAKKLHISRSYVSRIEKKALMLLKSKIKT